MSVFYENEEYIFRIIPDDIPNEGMMFVDHSKENRSGHLGHAMVEYADGQILAFYPNCNTDNNGHSGRGWMEYKRSGDGGLTWSEGEILAYSKQLYDLNIGYTSMSEKAVLCDDGKVLLFNLICDVSKSAIWEPYIAPTYLTSGDGGMSWSDAKRFTELYGRVYDVTKRDGQIYVLMSCCYNKDESSNGFRLFVSNNNGESFFGRSRLPFEPGRSYGSIEWLPDGCLIAYTYCPENEYFIEAAKSSDCGRSWSAVFPVYFEKRMRNPQVVRFCGSYFCFGRSGHYGENPGNIIVYCSEDGINWDSGRFLALRTAGLGAYSNTLITGTMRRDGSKRLIFQSSHAYYRNQTNILMWFIEAVEKTLK